MISRTSGILLRASGRGRQENHISGDFPNFRET